MLGELKRIAAALESAAASLEKLSNPMLYLDLPGAPPGFILDPSDNRTGSHTEGDGTGCAERVPPQNWEPTSDMLARGQGERTWR